MNVTVKLRLLELTTFTLKKMRSWWYVKAYGDYLRTNNHLDQKNAGVSLGIYN